MSEATVEQVLELKSKIDQEIGSRRPLTDKQFKVICDKLDQIQFTTTSNGWLQLFIYVVLSIFIVLK